MSDAVTLENVVHETCDYFGVKPDTLRSGAGKAEYRDARQVIMYLARKYTDATVDSIARAVGARDHAEVMHGIARLEEKMADEAELQHSVERIQQKMGIIQKAR